ncbi:MAG TPA: rhodanese-like domain-containing protein [Pseudomonadales bacterium]|jgi:rhodanese-related sulfurtransferase/catechol 2,3-dioxygenase-like lactoylglutathione lyase family enzyme|nr:rhodanese-like domain-containing protein [Pseudomonadales bacterium]
MTIESIFGVVDRLKSTLENLTIAQLKQEMAQRSDLLLLDIRELQETVDLGTLPGAVHAPRGMLEFWADPASPYYRDYFDETKRIVVFCAGGGRSAFAAKALIDMGYRNVAHLEAGFNGWKKAGEAVQDVAASSRWMRKDSKPKDERPPVWIGHALLAVPDVAASGAFFERLGLRLIEAHERVAILELRGGTHLILVPADSPTKARASFDLMVDDVDATHAALTQAGLGPSPIEDGDIHRSFTIVEPGGHSITINSSHASGLPV